MADDPGANRSITIGESAVGSIITTGDGNTIYVYQSVAAAVPLASGTDPYIGLLAFTENEADRFYGREALVGELRDRYAELICAAPNAGVKRFLAILGPSGSGKSSVARAGLVPELARRPGGSHKQSVTVLTPGGDPLDSLAVALARVSSNTSPPPDALRDSNRQALALARDGVYDGLHRIVTGFADAGTNLLILIDQFEEIYSLAADSPAARVERGAFIATLLHAAGAPGGPVSVVITMRSDYLGATQADPDLNQEIAKGKIVPAMTEAELIMAITLPSGGKIDASVAKVLADDVAGVDGALPLLQIALQRIWEGLEEGVPAATTLAKIGGVGGALGDTADRIYKGLSPEGQGIAQRVFLGLVQFDDALRPMRRRALLTDLVTGGHATPAEAQLAQTRDVVDAFASDSHRVLTLSADEAGQETVEVAHEAIFDHWGTLKDWLAKGMDDIRLHVEVTRAAKGWETDGRPEGDLWQSPNLDRLRTLAAKPTSDLSPIETDFFDASQAAHDRREREKKRNALLAASGAVLLIVLTAWALRSSVVATIKSHDDAVQRSNALAGASRQALDSGDGALALLLGLAALPTDGRDDPRYAQATAALQRALANQHELMDFQADGWLTAQLSPDGRTILATTDDLWIWDRSGRLERRIANVDDVRGISDDGAVVLVHSTNDHVQVIRMADLHVLADLKSPDLSAYLSPDGQRVLTTSGGYTLWTADGKRIESLPAPPGSDPDAQAAPAFSSGGRLLAIPAAGGADIWDSLTGELIRRLRSGSELPIGLMFSLDGRKLAIAFGQTVQVWDPISGDRPAGVFSTAPDELVDEARFSRSGDRLLVTTMEHAGTKPPLGSWIWSLPDGRRLARVQNLMRARTSDDGSVVVGLSDGLVEIYGGDGSEVCHTPAPQLDELHPVISPDAKAVLVLGETDLQLFAPASTDTTNCDRLVAEKLQSHTDEITSATFSADSEDVLTSSQDGTARLWRIGGPVGGLPSRVYPPGALFQGGYFAARSGDSWGVFDAVTGKPVATLQGVRMPISRFAVSADRRRVATFAGHALAVWDAANGARLTSLDTGAGGVLDFALSPQGDRLAIAYQDRTGELIDLSSGRRIAGLAHSGNLASVDFSADGRRLVTSAEQTAQVWDGRTGRPIGKPMIANNSRSADDNRIDSAELSADGRRVLITTQGAIASLWTVGSVEPSVVLRNGTSQVSSAAFTPDGRRVVTMGAEGEDKGVGVSVWDAASGQLLVSHDGGDDLAIASAPQVAPSNVAIVLAAGQDRFEWPARFYYGQALVKQACGRLARDFTPEERRTYGVNHAQAYCRGQNFPWLTQR